MESRKTKMEKAMAMFLISVTLLITMTSSKICTESDKTPSCEISTGCVCRSPKCISKVNQCPDKGNLTMISPMFQEIPPYAFENYKSLRNLEIIGGIVNRVSPKAFFGLSELRGLSLRDNLINNINNESLEGLNSLRELDLSGNVINNLDDTVFKGNKNLRMLNLDRNILNSITSSMFIGCQRLLSLYLTSNSISTIEPGAFNDLQNLEELYLDDNYISSITSNTFTGLSSLRYLTLNSNFIQGFLPGSLSPMMMLHTIDLSQNQIPIIIGNSFGSLSNLRRVFLNDNSIEWIDDKAFKDITSLEVLVLSRNRLESWSFVDFPSPSNLKELYLSFNRISDILLPTWTSKPQFPQLQYLELSNNLLSSFAAFFLNDAPLLGNPDVPSRTKFELRYNPLMCNCDSLALNNSMVQLDTACADNNTLDCVNGSVNPLNINGGKYCQVFGSPLPEIIWKDSNTGKVVTGYYNISSGITWLPDNVNNMTNYKCMIYKKDDGKSGRQETGPTDSSSFILPSFIKIITIFTVMYMTK